MVGMGTARPVLHRFDPSGGLLLGGGRMRNHNTSDILLWFNAEGAFLFSSFIAVLGWD
jgi:hypothetical protein